MLKETTSLAAWWGAIIATIVLLWDIYKWKTSGPRLYIDVSSNMEIFGVPGHEGKKYVTVRVRNMGDKPTTITSLAGRFYKGKFNRILKKQQKAFVVGTPGITQQLPYVLQPGTIWDGLIVQNEELERMATNWILMGELYFSHRKKPLVFRILI